jgi:hypothetical protein
MTAQIIQFRPRAIRIEREQQAWLVLAPNGHGRAHGDEKSAQADALWLAENFGLPIRSANS